MRDGGRSPPFVTTARTGDDEASPHKQTDDPHAAIPLGTADTHDIQRGRNAATTAPACSAGESFAVFDRSATCSSVWSEGSIRGTRFSVTLRCCLGLTRPCFSADGHRETTSCGGPEHWGGLTDGPVESCWRAGCAPGARNFLFDARATCACAFYQLRAQRRGDRAGGALRADLRLHLLGARMKRERRGRRCPRCSKATPHPGLRGLADAPRSAGLTTAPAR